MQVMVEGVMTFYVLDDILDLCFFIIAFVEL